MSIAALPAADLLRKLLEIIAPTSGFAVVRFPSPACDAARPHVETTLRRDMERDEDLAERARRAIRPGDATEWHFQDRRLTLVRITRPIVDA